MPKGEKVISVISYYFKTQIGKNSARDFFDGQKLLREIEDKYLYKLSIENGIVNVFREQTSINVGNGTSIAIN